MLNNCFTFHNNIILRTPYLPFVNTLISDTAFTLINNQQFMEALYLASPVLYAQCIKWKNGLLKTDKEIIKIQTSLIKYYKRMYSRCTPFGLFANCSVVEWGNETKIHFEKNSIQRQTRLDMHYLCALTQYISNLPFLKEILIYKPNNSYYEFDNKI